MAKAQRLSLDRFCCEWGCPDCHRLRESSAGIYSDHILGVNCGTCEWAGENGIDQGSIPPVESKGAAIVLDTAVGPVRFYGPNAEDHALAYLDRKGGYEHPDVPIGAQYTRLAEALYPLCEHGMSADLCEGPNHYPTYEQERASYGY
jgi:hypothetical protein